MLGLCLEPCAGCWAQEPINCPARAVHFFDPSSGIRGFEAPNLIELGLEMETRSMTGRADKCANATLSGMRGFKVQNLLETWNPIGPLFDDGSHSKMLECTPVRDARVRVAKPPRDFASDRAFVR